MLPAKRVPFCALHSYSAGRNGLTARTPVFCPLPHFPVAIEGKHRPWEAVCAEVEVEVAHKLDCTPRRKTFQFDPVRGLLLLSLSLRTMVAPGGGGVTPLACSFSLVS